MRWESMVLADHVGANPAFATEQTVFSYGREGIRRETSLFIFAIIEE